MSDEKPEAEAEEEKSADEVENEVAEEPEPDTPDDKEEGPRPYIRWTSTARRGSIWNTPVGLAVVGILVSKGMDLAYRAFIEREKTIRAQNQNPQQKQK